MGVPVLDLVFGFDSVVLHSAEHFFEKLLRLAIWTPEADFLGRAWRDALSFAKFLINFAIL